jgi:hypothetical protein
MGGVILLLLPVCLQDIDRVPLFHCTFLMLSVHTYLDFILQLFPRTVNVGRHVEPAGWLSPTLSAAVLARYLS